MPVPHQPVSGSGASWVMAILDVLSQGHAESHEDGLSVADVARLMGRDKSVVSRQMRSLRDAGFIVRNPSGRHELSWRLFSMVANADNLRMTRVAAPLLAELAERVREKTYLTVLSEGKALTVHAQNARLTVATTDWIGRAVPLRGSSSGIALVMDLDEASLSGVLQSRKEGAGQADDFELLQRVHQARDCGYAVADRTFDPDSIGIGAPVRTVAGEAIAAVNISGPATRIGPNVPVLAGRLMHTVRALERALNARPV